MLLLIFYYVKKREIGSNNGELQTSPTPDVNPDGKLNLFKIERTRDGFAVSMSDGQDVPYSIRIDLAYNSKKIRFPSIVHLILS